MLRGGPGLPAQAGAAPVFTCRVEPACRQGRLSHWDQPANAKILRCLIFAVITQLMAQLVDSTEIAFKLSNCAIKKSDFLLLSPN